MIHMQKLTNLTNSPQAVPTTEGHAIIPAFGTADGDFDEAHVSLLVQVGAVRVEPIAKTKRKAASNVEQDSAEE